MQLRNTALVLDASRAISNRTRIETLWQQTTTEARQFLPEQFPIEQGLKLNSTFNYGSKQQHFQSNFQ